jgi:hypothetical protein
MKRDVQFLRTIDTPYAVVRGRLHDDAAAVLGDRVDEAGRAVATVAAEFHGRHLEREIAVEVVAHEAPEGSATGSHLLLRAEALEHPERYPMLEARFDALPLGEDRTALFFIATYSPPLGWIGGAADTVALHRYAEVSLQRYFDGAAGRLSAPS